METRSKAYIIDAVAAKTELKKKEAEAAVNAALETISKELSKGNKVQLIGFGTFDVKSRAARAGRNPKTGAAIKIAPSKSVGFKTGKALKETL